METEADRAQMVIDSVPNGILGVNRAGLITLVNHTAAQMFGYEKGELLGQPVEMLLPPVLRGGHPGLRSAFFANPQARAMGGGRDLFAIRKDGSEFPVEIGLNPTTTPSAGEPWVLCSIVDISERKHAEEKNALLAAIVDSSDDAILSKTLDSIITSWNSAAERLFGYSASEVIGRHIGIIIPPFQDDETYILERLRKGERLQHFETIRLHRTGRKVPVSLNVSPVRDARGQVVGASSIVRDISQQQIAVLEREKSELAIADNATRMAAVMNTIVDGLITIDENGVIQSFNSGAERIFGYSQDEMMGQNVKVLMSEPYHSAHDSYLGKYQETGVKSIIGVGREVTAKRKDGTVFPMDLAVGEMILHDRRMYVGILRDITARKRVEDERTTLIATLKQSNQELDDFAYIASHDLKEPLRGLFNNAQFLKEDYAEVVDETGMRRLDRICFLCERMERLIDNLLYFSRLGRQEMAYRNTDLNAVVHDILEQTEGASGQPGLSVQVKERLPVLVCDATRVGEVYRNLIANAIKYNNKPEKLVEIGCLEEYSGQRNVLYVRDNGVGIPLEFKRDVFTIFKRLQPEEDKVRGSGVGLTFAKKIVERHGGQIWLESQPDRGTTFFFTLQEGQPYE